jgi:hypothetical protein
MSTIHDRRLSAGRCSTRIDCAAYPILLSSMRCRAHKGRVLVMLLQLSPALRPGRTLAVRDIHFPETGEAVTPAGDDDCRRDWMSGMREACRNASITPSKSLCRPLAFSPARFECMGESPVGRAAIHHRLVVLGSPYESVPAAHQCNCGFSTARRSSSRTTTEFWHHTIACRSCRTFL